MREAADQLAAAAEHASHRVVLTDSNKRASYLLGDGLQDALDGPGVEDRHGGGLLRVSLLCEYIPLSRKPDTPSLTGV